MHILESEDYREIIKGYIKGPYLSRGGHSRLAEAIGLHTTTLSQTLKGGKSLSPEHAILIAEYFAFSEVEKSYLLLLVNHERAGNSQLKKWIADRIRELRKQRYQIKAVLPANHELRQEQSLTFYSSWIFSAIRVVTSLPKFGTPEAISAKLGLPLTQVIKALNFLTVSGLCVEESGSFRPGPKYTHVDKDSLFAKNHHCNWRLKAVDRYSQMSDKEIAYTSPMSLSYRDAETIKALILSLIKKTNEIREPSECEATYFLNIDWLEF